MIFSFIHRRHSLSLLEQRRSSMGSDSCSISWESNLSKISIKNFAVALTSLSFSDTLSSVTVLASLHIYPTLYSRTHIFVICLENPETEAAPSISLLALCGVIFLVFLLVSLDLAILHGFLSYSILRSKILYQWPFQPPSS